MLYARIKNGSVVTTNIKREYKNTSFARNMPDEFDGWKKIVDDGASPPDGQVVDRKEVKQVGDGFKVVYYYRDKTSAELKQENLNELEQTDKQIIRVLEELIEILVTNQTISLSDFPQAMRSALVRRKQLRDAINQGD